MKVAVALGRLGPELACDLDHRLHAKSINLDLADPIPDLVQSLDRLRTIQMVVNLARRVERIAQLFPVHESLGEPAGPALHDFEHLAIAHA
jgi:hypothetical protein